MTTLNEARTAIYAAMLQAELLDDVVFDNEAFDAARKTPWMRLTVRHTGASQNTLGRPSNRKFERRGTVIIQVFVPSDSGTKRADELAQMARAVYEGKTLDGANVLFYEGRTIELGIDGPYYQINVELPFRYYETL